MEIVRHHHEGWDGQGYPDRLKGLDIPFGARVIAVADSFDAMSSDRPYRAGMPLAKAAQILRDGRGKQWEPAIIDAFLRQLEREHPYDRPEITSEANPIAAATLAEPAAT